MNMRKYKIKCENGMKVTHLRDSMNDELAGLQIGSKGNIWEGVRS